VDAFASDWARDNLHRTGAVIAPPAYTQLPHAAAARREQRRVLAK
jgi:hypothetical protein